MEERPASATPSALADKLDRIIAHYEWKNDAELARRLGVDSSQISRWRRRKSDGGTCPSGGAALLLFRLALGAGVDITPDDVSGQRDAPTSEPSAA